MLKQKVVLFVLLIGHFEWNVQSQDGILMYVVTHNNYIFITMKFKRDDGCST